jgi:hypothetical protein
LQGGGRIRRLRVYDVGGVMSEAEKKGSKWPWILVPVGAVGLFFILRECQQRIPAAEPRAQTQAAPASPAPP